MISLLDINQWARGLDAITSAEYFSRPDEFHPEGVFSEDIFGVVGSLERKKIYAYIDLQATIIHPTALDVILRLDKKISKFLSTESSFSLDKDGMLVEDENGVTGISEFVKMFPKIEFRTGTTSREKFVNVLKKEYKSGNVFINKLPVIPPEYRSAYKDESSGEWVIDKLNDMYQVIIRRTFQVKSSGGGPLLDLLTYALQNSVKDHDAYIRTKIAKKSGLIRNQMLGKRTDFSGRAVITPGPDLKIDEVGLPLRMAVSLFEPFIIHHLMYKNKIITKRLENEIKDYTGLDLSVDNLRRVLKGIRGGDKIPEGLYEVIYEAAEVSMRGRVVLVKRDPVLHTGSYAAYYPILHSGDTIQMCTMQVGAHNADFDGDTMAVYHPITDEAQEEARTRMMTGIGTARTDSLNFELSKEMWVGLYTLTKGVKKKQSPIAVKEEDLENANDPTIPVKYKGMTTTMGRAIFNSCFPKAFPFQDGVITKKLGNSIIKELSKKYKMETIKDSVSKMEKVAFKWATIMSPSITLDILELPSEVYTIKKKIESSSPEEAEVLLKQAEKIVKKHIKDTGFGDLMDSGAGKGMGQAMQILVAKGIIADPQGNVLDPISGSYSDGLSNKEFFNASSGARKGIIDRVLNTADTGYMSRKLAFVLNSVEADQYLMDCGTKKTLTIKLTSDLMKRLDGRYVGSKVFKEKDYKVGQVIKLRSPMFCKSSKICFKCYGELLKRHRSPYIGIIAAQSIGERGTQMIMRTFHTGGAVELIKHDMTQDIIDGDPLSNLDKGSISKYLNQEENNLVTKSPCSVTISLADYKTTDSIKLEDDKLWVKSVIARVEYADVIFDMVLDYSVSFSVYEIEKTREFIKLTFPPNSTVLEVSTEASEIKGQVAFVERLLGGREILKDAQHLYKRVLGVYSPPLTDMDSVHIEVLCSQVLRNKDNIHIPARLVEPYDPVLINIKKVVFSGGFLQGLAFENVGEAIRTGLISEEDIDPSIIEKIVTGDVLETKKR